MMFEKVTLFRTSSKLMRFGAKFIALNEISDCVMNFSTMFINGYTMGWDLELVPS